MVNKSKRACKHCGHICDKHTIPYVPQYPDDPRGTDWGCENENCKCVQYSPKKTRFEIKQDKLFAKRLEKKNKKFFQIFLKV